MPFSILAHPSSILPRGLGQRIERAPRPPLVSSEVSLFARKSTRVFAGFSISGGQFWRERRFDSLRTSPLEEQQDKLGEHCIKLDKFFGSKTAPQCGMAKKVEWPVYLYIPNIIGYIRIIANCIAFAHCFSDKKVFAALYFVSFVCDELDGRFARMFNQVSTFGAVLDMVTDRVSTACLLVVLSHFYRSCFTFFLALLALDIASHWLQMYSTFLSSKTSHKDVKDSTSWLLRAYYGHRLFMGYCCVGSEILYIILFLASGSQSESVIDVLVNNVRNKSMFSLPILVALPGWAVKQVVNVIQMKTAADVCVLYDTNRRERP
ncbi:probable CDP-diacylglycerol--inositol 3-phosphatidyltransferase 2 [Nymphaea colorata]|nr:probable CDP-diacylglycerol--inositol 3-phosphatidyltransferase 2 [Nymphaea colorata]